MTGDTPLLSETPQARLPPEWSASASTVHPSSGPKSDSSPFSTPLLTGTVLSGSGGVAASPLGLEEVSVQQSSSPEVLAESERCLEEAPEGTAWPLSDMQGTPVASSPGPPAVSSNSPRGVAGGGQGAREMWCAEFFGFLSLVGLDRGLLRQLT